MFGKLLIANRGEIACRVARTARRLGIRTVAVYSDADAHAAHVQMCDEAVHIGGPRPQESYLRGDVILEAARRTGAEAIHPGYGFLSENAEFARACAAAGVVFVGPTPDAIDAMGSKSSAKALMERAGVPLTPGYHGERQEPDYLLTEARRIGFPVLIKAVAGGGGKGMRRVDRAEDFSAALASCQRESQSSFGDERVLVEKYVTPARHIEVQVFGDTHGNCVYLFERDCSVQRRHQKVIEEAPAPGMTEARRRQMGEAAVAAARAVDYRGAGTVEFIAAPDGSFYFMEMNTRLQVEHPVTEMITGLDLVEWQLRVAAGETLPMRQEQLAIRGHAIEARVYAEDPARGFLPSIGTLEYLAMPKEDARIDTGVRQGDIITPFYDPMIAKLIVHGSTRQEAIAKLRGALMQFHVVGVRTNIEFLHRLTDAPSFIEARLDTALIERESACLFPPREPLPGLVWDLAALAYARVWRGPRGAGSPWDETDHWRNSGAGERHWTLRHEDEVQELRLSMGPSALRIHREGVSHTMSGEIGSGGTLRADIDGVTFEANVFIRGGAIHLFRAGRHHVLEWVDPYLPVSTAQDHHGGLVAPMPGRIIAVLVENGARVAAGTALVVMEAMKMEHTVTAPFEGVVADIHCDAGDQVREGDELLKLSPAS
jgi:3-methylcrotonyl-CoA carboxylase alpha subunit